MKRELKQKWTDGLRSGKYKQAHGYLRSSEGYCCLGVLLDVLGKGQWERDDCSHGIGYFLDVAALPSPVFLLKELEGRGREATGLSNSEEARCITLNDTEKLPFSDIASWVDANVEEEE